MKNTADIIIIGAGIIGPSTAYHLSKNGAKNIIVLDSFSAGGLATNATAAMVMHQTGVELTTQMAKLSIEKYKNFKDEVGVDIEYKNNGSIVYTNTKSGETILRKQAIMQNRNGVISEILDSSDIESKSKGILNGMGLNCGIYAHDDAYINANLAVNAYLNYAIKKGTIVKEKTKVTKIIVDKNKVTAVETDQGHRIYTETVINCAGAYAGDVANTIGFKLPIKANKKCLGIIENKEYKDFPIAEDIDQGWYFRPHSKGILIGFGLGEWVEDEDREEFPRFEQKKIEELNNYLKLRFPNLLPVKLLDSWAGYRPMIDPIYNDALPIIGPVDGIKGYFNNCGYGEFGITHAPIAGELLAQIIFDKKTSVDAKPFLLSRFGK